MRLEMLREKSVNYGLRDLLFLKEKHMSAALVYVEFEIVNSQVITPRCEVLIVVGGDEAILVAVEHKHWDLLSIHPG